MSPFDGSPTLSSGSSSTGRNRPHGPEPDRVGPLPIVLLSVACDEGSEPHAFETEMSRQDTLYAQDGV